jgi:hypothetical protein
MSLIRGVQLREATGSYATTGSNAFIGNQIVTGSLFTTGSNTLIGSTTLTGSFSVSGSTLQTGNNTLIGNTTLSGSIEVSGSSNFHNSSFTVTGSSNFKGDINFDGNVNVVYSSSFYHWGNKLFNYGAFSDTTTQSGSRNTAHIMSFNTTDIGGYGVSIVDGTKITVDNTGIYNIQFSAQLDRTTSGTNIASIWFAYTGSNIANSATDVTITGGAAANPVVAAWNYVLPMSASSYVEILWSHNDNADDKVQIKAVPTRTDPVRPAVPSIILTVTQVA